MVSKLFLVALVIANLSATMCFPSDHRALICLYELQTLYSDKMCSKVYSVCLVVIMVADYQECPREKGPFHKNEIFFFMFSLL